MIPGWRRGLERSLTKPGYSTSREKDSAISQTKIVVVHLPHVLTSIPHEKRLKDVIVQINRTSSLCFHNLSRSEHLQPARCWAQVVAGHGESDLPAPARDAILI